MRWLIKDLIAVPVIAAAALSLLLVWLLLCGLLIFASIFGYPPSWLRLMRRFDAEVLLLEPRVR